MNFGRNLLNIIILLCVYLNKGFTEGAQEKESGKVDYHTIQLSSLSPSSSCVLSAKEYDTKSSLRVVHKHGACSPLRSGKAARLDHADILRRDKARVNFIHSKLSNNLDDQTHSNDIPVKDESKRKEDLGSGSYIVTIGIGTPQHNQPLIVDTGSDLTWTKCKQCGRTISCYSKNKLIFNPSSSTSFDTVSSTSRVCSDLKSAGIHRDCSAPRCCYGIEYKDHSSSDGFLRVDTCYDPRGFDTMAVPKVSFSFGGGTTVELGFNGILYPVNASHVCLAFAGNDNDGEVAIFGSVQQMTLQVVYDKAGGRIGFAQNGCS